MYARAIMRRDEWMRSKGLYGAAARDIITDADDNDCFHVGCREECDKCFHRQQFFLSRQSIVGYKKVSLVTIVRQFASDDIFDIDMEDVFLMSDRVA